MKRAFFSVHSGIAARSMVSLARLIEQSQALRITFIIRTNPKEDHCVLKSCQKFEADNVFIEFLHGIRFLTRRTTSPRALIGLVDSLIFSHPLSEVQSICTGFRGRPIPHQISQMGTSRNKPLLPIVKIACMSRKRPVESMSADRPNKRVTTPSPRRSR